MNDTMTYTGELTITACWCGTTYAVPAELYAHMMRKRDNGERQPNVYCPLGHTWIISGRGKAEVEAERAERLAATLVATRDQLHSEERSHAATKGQLTKARKRAAKGVCLECNRSFINVARHVATCHPTAAAS